MSFTAVDAVVVTMAILAVVGAWALGYGLGRTRRDEEIVALRWQVGTAAECQKNAHGALRAMMDEAAKTIQQLDLENAELRERCGEGQR